MEIFENLLISSFSHKVTSKIFTDRVSLYSSGWPQTQDHTPSLQGSGLSRPIAVPGFSFFLKIIKIIYVIRFKIIQVIPVQCSLNSKPLCTSPIGWFSQNAKGRVVHASRDLFSYSLGGWEVQGQDRLGSDEDTVPSSLDDSFWNCGDGSLGKIFGAYAKEPEFEFLSPHVLLKAWHCRTYL